MWIQFSQAILGSDQMRRWDDSAPSPESSARYSATPSPLAWNTTPCVIHQRCFSCLYQALKATRLLQNDFPRSNAKYERRHPSKVRVSHQRLHSPNTNGIRPLYLKAPGTERTKANTTFPTLRAVLEYMTGPNPIPSTQQEAAYILLMLSRDSWSRRPPLANARSQTR